MAAHILKTLLKEPLGTSVTLTCRQLLPASDEMNMPTLLYDSSAPMFPANHHKESNTQHKIKYTSVVTVCVCANGPAFLHFPAPLAGVPDEIAAN